MKHIQHILYVTALTLLPHTLAQGTTSDRRIKPIRFTTTHPNTKPDRTDEIVITHFLGALGSFAKIMEDPENSQNVGTHATNILAHCISAFVEAVNRGKLSLSSTPEEVRTYMSKIVKRALKQRSIISMMPHSNNRLTRHCARRHKE